MRKIIIELMTFKLPCFDFSIEEKSNIKKFESLNKRKEKN